MVAGEHHGTVVLIEGETVVGALRKFECRHVVVFRRCLSSSRDRRHGDVGQDVAFKTQGTASPSDLNQPVVALVHRQFAAPILLEHHASDQGQGRGDGTGVKFAVDCREHQAPIIKADEFQRYLAGRQIDADARTGLHFGDGDVEQQFTVEKFDARAAQHGSVGDGAHFIVHVLKLSVCITGGRG